MRRKRTALILLLSILIVTAGTAGSPAHAAGAADTEVTVTAADISPVEAAEQQETIYSLVHRYFHIKAVCNGQYLLGNRAGYEAQAVTPDQAMTFYFQPSDLGEYIFYDADGKYMTYNGFNAIVRNKTLDDRTRFSLVDEGDGKFALFSYQKQKYVGIRGTSLVWRNSPDETALFTFEECEGSNPFPEADTNVLITDESGSAVTDEEAMARPAVGESIIGYADTHAHINHNLGSGQATFSGAAFSPLGITKALEDCSGNHGSGGVLDLWGAIVDGAKGHATSGYPNFEYWPTSYSTDHQQTYYKWLERSYLAGQRVLVQQCVNNEPLGKLMNSLPPYKNGPTDDMQVVDLQIDNIYKMQDYIDAQCGGPGEGWFRIVTTPEQAREVIAQGKMAVFIGIEVDTLFGVSQDYIGAYEAGQITEDQMNAGLQSITDQLDEYYAKGVRSLFMIHAMNNGFSGCQLYQGEIFSIMNKLATNDFYQPEVSSNPRVFYKQPKANLPADAQGHGNVQGLTETGKWLVHQMIDRKMIIEADHLSDNSFNDLLDIVWEEKYPGIICSHTRILDMFDPEDQAWEQLDIPRMIKVYQLGGIISPMLWETLDEHQMCASDYLQYMIDLSIESEEPTIGVLDNPTYQVYGGPYEVPTTWYNQNDDASDDLILGVPYGSDVNGACMLPNFDKFSGVYGDVNYDDGSFDELYSGVYDSSVSSVSFERQTTGIRTFDINGDRGVAHYGLIPDLIQKMSTRSDIVNLDATFHSAEAYIRMLERVEKYSDTYPSRDDSQWLVTSTEYWHD